MPRTDHTLRELQVNLPWTIRYSRDFRANPQPHKDFAHALTHVGKAAGYLHAFVDDMDHRRDEAEAADVRERYEKYVADLVVCALRMANTFPGGPIDLQAAVKERLEGKNGVKLRSPADGPSSAISFMQPLGDGIDEEALLNAIRRDFARIRQAIGAEPT